MGDELLSHIVQKSLYVHIAMNLYDLYSKSEMRAAVSAGHPIPSQIFASQQPPPPFVDSLYSAAHFRKT